LRMHADVLITRSQTSLSSGKFRFNEIVGANGAPVVDDWLLSEKENRTMVDDKYAFDDGRDRAPFARDSLEHTLSFGRAFVANAQRLPLIPGQTHVLVLIDDVTLIIVALEVVRDSGDRVSLLVAAGARVPFSWRKLAGNRNCADSYLDQCEVLSTRQPFITRCEVPPRRAQFAYSNTGDWVGVGANVSGIVQWAEGVPDRFDPRMVDFVAFRVGGSKTVPALFVGPDVLSVNICNNSNKCV